MQLLDEIDFVEFRYDDPQWGWTKWRRFSSTRDAQTWALFNLSEGTKYQIQTIRSRWFSA